MDSTDSSERSGSNITESTNTNENTSIKELLADSSEEKVYEYFSQTAWNLREVVESFDVLKERLGLANKYGLDLYRGLRLTLGAPNCKTWKARDMLNLLDKRANQKEYMQQKAACGIKVFIIGAGPAGLRLAIDCMLLGAEVVVVEKRKSFSRNNVLHLWPFTIEDLRQLGAKKFYGKFCAGAIDHVSIRCLQCMLLKVALLLGLKFYPGIEFQEIKEPEGQLGWHASLKPSDHPLNLFDFDVLVGADGARKSRVPGFDRKELRGKLALAITANFKNYYTRDEAAVQEISGVAFIFNQKFFKDLKEDTDIDLENIVYYKDDTHYFVMTAKKDSLLRKGVLRHDYPDAAQLLQRQNIDMESLYEYSREAANWCTDLPKLDFAENHNRGKDVALFDFTSIHQAEYAAQAINRQGRDLYLCLVGDALLEPFWPIGTGAARGFLSAMDTAWMVKRIGQKKSVLEILCERESVFQRLPQTNPENLCSNHKAYTISPKSRYPNLHLHRLKPADITHLYDTDDTLPSPALRHGSVKVKRLAEAAPVLDVIVEPVVGEGSGGEVEISEEDEDKENVVVVPVEKKRKAERVAPPPPLSAPVRASPKRKSLRSRGSTHLAYYAEPEDLRSLKDPTVLLHWLQNQVKGYGVKVTDLTSSWSDGMALCSLIYHYHPELIPNFKRLSPREYIRNNELAFSVAEEHFGISRLLTPKEMKKPDRLTLLSYLSLFYEMFHDTDPATPEGASEPMLTEETMMGTTPVDREKRGVSTPERESTSTKKRKKSLFRRSSKKKLLGVSPSSAERSWNTKSVKRDLITPTSPPVSKMEGATPLATIQEKQQAPPKTNSTPKLSRNITPTTLGFKPPSTDSSDFCYFCNKRVYLMERMSANGFFFHRTCFRCSHCNCQLKIGGYSLSKGTAGEKGKFFCSAHYRQLFLSNPEAINYSRAGAGGKGAKDNEPAEGSAAKEEEKMETEMETERVAGRDAEVKSKSPPRCSTDEEIPLSSDESRGEETPKKKKKASLRQRLGTWSMGMRPKSQSRSRSSSAEPEVKTSTEDEHRQISQQHSPAKLKSSDSGSGRSSSEDKVEAPVRQSRAHTISGPTPMSKVQLLSKGFEQLEANARDTEIQLGTEGRERAKSQLARQQSGPIPQPFEVKPTSLAVIQETGGSEAAAKRSPRARSPARWRGTLQQSRSHIEEVQGISRSSKSLNRRPQRKGRGQRSVSRPLIDNYATSDVALQERRKQQRRLFDAQQIQREMSQLERQYDELEEVGRDIEQALRDAEETKQEEPLMKSWLGLVNERNGLVRKTSELSLRMKELELEDRQYEIDKKLSALSNLTEEELTEEELAKFEDLCSQKIKIVEERDELVNQTEEERLRELEEDGTTQEMLNDKFALGQRSSDESDEDYDVITANGIDSDCRRGSAPARTIQENTPPVNKKEKRKSWWSFGKN